MAPDPTAQARSAIGSTGRVGRHGQGKARINPVHMVDVAPAGVALVSNRKESIAARRQAGVLFETKARLRELAERHGQVGANGLHGASHHPLAGLSHRSLLLDWLDRTLVGESHREEALTLLLLDLDRFDDANRNLGYAAGDRLLQVVAERLLSCVPNDPVASLHQGDGGMPLPGADRIPAAPRSATSRLTDFCLFAGLDVESTPHVARLMSQRIRLLKGEVLYRVGSAFRALFAIRTGTCKSVLLTRGGNEQVAGYHMAGEIIGTEGIATGTHGCQAIALEDMEVCPLAFDRIERLVEISGPFRHNLHQLMAQEYVRAQNRMLVLGTMPAEQRLAVFLVDLSQRYGARGYSSFEFVLRMSRDEIGSYLGIALETVSRLFSRFQREGLIQVQGRTVKLLDRVAMNQLADGGA